MQDGVVRIKLFDMDSYWGGNRNGCGGGKFHPCYLYGPWYHTQRCARKKYSFVTFVSKNVFINL